MRHALHTTLVAFIAIGSVLAANAPGTVLRAAPRPAPARQFT